MALQLNQLILSVILLIQVFCMPLLTWFSHHDPIIMQLLRTYDLDLGEFILFIIRRLMLTQEVRTEKCQMF